MKTRGLSAELTFDLTNVLNPLHPSWGIVQTANPMVQLFRVRREQLSTQNPPELIASYVGARRRGRETGKIMGSRPLAPEVPTSQWRAQLGARVWMGR